MSQFAAYNYPYGYGNYQINHLPRHYQPYGGLSPYHSYNGYGSYGHYGNGYYPSYYGRNRQPGFFRGLLNSFRYGSYQHYPYSSSMYDSHRMYPSEIGYVSSVKDLWRSNKYY